MLKVNKLKGDPTDPLTVATYECLLDGKQLFLRFNEAVLALQFTNNINTYCRRRRINLRLRRKDALLFLKRWEETLDQSAHTGD